MEYRLVDGADFASSASVILQRAWQPPGLFYSAEYLEWQLSFPGPFPVPAVAAFDGSKPVGFAASAHRRVRCGTAAIDAVIVSFVGVDPDFRSRGIAAGLYANLLAVIAKHAIPVLTYAQSGSAGARAIERAYPLAGFSLHPLGAFPVYGFLVRPETDVQAWAPAAAGQESAILRSLVDSAVTGAGRILSDPSAAQLQHYLADPRGRRLLVQRNGAGHATGAAWAVPIEHTSANGSHSVITLDCVWLSTERVDALPGLAAAAARLWPDPSSRQPVVVQASSLAGFDPQTLRQAGFRQIATPFQGYGAVSSARHPVLKASGSNLEVV